MQVEQVYLRLKAIATQFVDLSLGIKLLIGSIIGALGGSTFIGFISEYATYYFAYYHGARLPVEGVPYLKLAVTLVSLAIFGGTLLCFGVMYWILRQLLAMTVHYARSLPWVREEDLPLEALPLRRYILVGLPAVLVATLPIFLSFTIQSFEVTPAESVWWVPAGMSPRWFVLVGYLATALVLVVLARKPKGVKWFMTSLSLVLVVGISASLFTPTVYGEFLRGIRFGGGIEVVVSRNCDGLPDCRNLETGYLLLRTREAAILYRERSAMYVEIPTNQIRSYEYMPSPKWKLPRAVQRGGQLTPASTGRSASPPAR